MSVSNRPLIRPTRSPFRNRWTEVRREAVCRQQRHQFVVTQASQVRERLTVLVRVDEHAVRRTAEQLPEWLWVGRYVTHRSGPTSREQLTGIEVLHTSKRTRLKRRKVEQKGTYASASTIVALGKRLSRCIEINDAEPGPRALGKIADFAQRVGSLRGVDPAKPAGE